MNVLFDHQIFAKQQFGGASKYFCEVLKRFPRDVWETTTWLSNNEYVHNLNLFRHQPFFPKDSFKGKPLLMDVLNRPYTLFRMATGRYEVFHQTDYSTYYFGALKGRKMVTTMHDMNNTLWKNSYTNTLTNDVHQRERLQRASAERADHIIAVSQNTRKDLMEQWNIPAEKISVIHHGVDKTLPTASNPTRFLAEPYLLYVGERFGFKNFSLLMKAFSLLHARYPELRLVCTGRGFSADEQRDLHQLGIAHKVVQIGADEQTMARLYRDAEMFVYTSLSEGFGMPLLESMVNRCPVVVGNVSCLPEVAGEAGWYFDPREVDDLVVKIEQLLLSPTLRQELMQKGLRRLEAFSWKKSAAEHLAVYQSLCP
jgi:glycosyltransferase involved in cell wall biosynthesis